MLEALTDIANNDDLIQGMDLLNLACSGSAVGLCGGGGAADTDEAGRLSCSTRTAPLRKQVSINEQPQATTTAAAAAAQVQLQQSEPRSCTPTAAVGAIPKIKLSHHRGKTLQSSYSLPERGYGACDVIQELSSANSDAETESSEQNTSFIEHSAYTSRDCLREKRRLFKKSASTGSGRRRSAQRRSLTQRLLSFRQSSQDDDADRREAEVSL